MDGASAFSSPASYVSRLFMVQYNLILVGGAALFSAASASAAPLAAAAVGELIWLGLGSTSPSVRRWLDRRDASLGRDAEGSERAASRSALDPEYARRALAFERALREIRGFGGRSANATFARAVARLETLVPVHRSLCETHQRLASFLTTTNDAELAAEAARLKARFAAEKDIGLRLTLKQALGSAQRRVEHRRSTIELVRSIGVKLESAERSVAYLRSQGLSLAANPGLYEDVEALIAEIGPPISVEVEPRDGLDG